MKINSKQKKHLKGLAHKLKPVVYIGQHGLSEAVIKSVDEALNDHELIKIKFNEFKEKTQKNEISREIEKKTGAAQVGMIGHVVTFYRRHSDPDKRIIDVP